MVVEDRKVEKLRKWRKIFINGGWLSVSCRKKSNDKKVGEEERERLRKRGGKKWEGKVNGRGIGSSWRRRDRTQTTRGRLMGVG
jgi:hypothetical protein